MGFPMACELRRATPCLGVRQWPPQGDCSLQSPSKSVLPEASFRHTRSPATAPKNDGETGLCGESTCLGARSSRRSRTWAAACVGTYQHPGTAPGHPLWPKHSAPTELPALSRYTRAACAVSPCPSVCLSACLSIHPSTRPSTCASIRPSTHSPPRPFINPSVRPSVHPPICLSIHLSTCLSVIRLSVCSILDNKFQRREHEQTEDGERRARLQ